MPIINVARHTHYHEFVQKPDRFGGTRDHISFTSTNTYKSSSPGSHREAAAFVSQELHASISQVYDVIEINSQNAELRSLVADATTLVSDVRGQCLTDIANLRSECISEDQKVEQRCNNFTQTEVRAIVEALSQLTANEFSDAFGSAIPELVNALVNEAVKDMSSKIVLLEERIKTLEGS